MAAEQKETEAAERFDASQYAFFGAEAQEVELGGLDEEDATLDQLNGLEDEDELPSPPADVDEIDVPPEVVDVADLANSFTKLHTERRLSEPDLGVRNFPDDRELLEQYAWAETLRSFQQRRWGRESPNPAYSLPSSPGWPGQPSGTQANQFRQQFPNLQAGSVLQHGNVGLPQFPSSVQQAGPWLQANIGASLLQRHLSPQANVLPPQVLHQRPQVSVRPYGQAHPQQQGYGLVTVLQAHKFSHDDSDNRQGPYPSRKEEYRSKYMTADEIETILRIQWTATHSSDPYVEDYYHQAVQAKQAGATPHGRRHFAPSHLRDLPSHARSTAEPHAYLQVEALGRIPYSSIRRPRPLLEVEDAGSNTAAAAAAAGEDKPAVDAAKQRRLEQEPMLVARIAVEDGLCLLLDVDDIDRMLSVSQQPEDGMQLRKRRQILLDGLAASLQLVDPLAPGSGSAGHFGLSATKDDLVFLRLVSLPKGRKLVARYLGLLVPGSERVRIVAMAVLRHLRFLFGGAQSDSESSSVLARAVASAIMHMDLASLSACLAAVVLAQEPPPLRPVGSPAGDGATIVLQAVLDRATMILSDRNVSMQQQQYRVENTTVWQASFDAFFSLLSNYCSRKYESIMHSLRMSSSSGLSSAAAASMARAMPIELLKASLPHTNEQQRQRLLEFAQRSMVAQEQQHSNSSTPAPPPAAAARG